MAKPSEKLPIVYKTERFMPKNQLYYKFQDIFGDKCICLYDWKFQNFFFNFGVCLELSKAPVWGVFNA